MRPLVRPQHGEILYLYFEMMMKKSLIQNHTHFGEEPLIPITFLRRSKGFPSLSFNLFTETLRAIPHFLEKFVILGCENPSFYFLGPGSSLGGYIQLFCCLSQSKYPFIYLLTPYRFSPYRFSNFGCHSQYIFSIYRAYMLKLDYTRY